MSRVGKVILKGEWLGVKRQCQQLLGCHWSGGEGCFQKGEWSPVKRQEGGCGQAGVKAQGCLVAKGGRVGWLVGGWVGGW